MPEPYLKPCPFCGGSHFAIIDRELGGRAIECANDSCKASVKVFGATHDRAADHWNTRAVNSHEALVQALEAARPIIDKYCDSHLSDEAAALAQIDAALKQARGEGT